jgi:triphosphoribosyl-dephospho-CoA synthase
MSTPVEAAFLDACRAELEALKPGNVHRHAAGHGMTVDDFLRSAEAAAPAIAAMGEPVGRRILGAVEATRAAVGQNTNLGILLLCAPLALAAERAAGPAALWPALEEVLASLTVDDARLAYRAIRLASPGGLGRSGAADVQDEPAITLLEAMRLAAERDRIAWNYANGFADIRDTGLPALAAHRGEGWDVTATYLAFLGSLDDTHIVRKLGPGVAREVRLRAAELSRRLALEPDPSAQEGALLAFDAELKAAGINPGTSADLTVATVFARNLLDLLPIERVNRLP